MPGAGPCRRGAPMRISGGNARGIELLVPKGDAVRPATDGMRQSVFSSLGPRIAGARFVDLFAGSGAYGLEAFSRGASGGTFVERNAKASACLRRNIAAVCKSLGKGGEELLAVEADALSLPVGTGDLPELIFVDPPYDMISEIAPPLFGRLDAALPADWAGLVVFEMPRGDDELKCARRVVLREAAGARCPPAKRRLLRPAGRGLGDRLRDRNRGDHRGFRPQDPPTQVCELEAGAAKDRALRGRPSAFRPESERERRRHARRRHAPDGLVVVQGDPHAEGGKRFYGIFQAGRVDDLGQPSCRTPARRLRGGGGAIRLISQSVLRGISQLALLGLEEPH